MKNKIIWIDLAICSLLLLAILGGRNYWNMPLQFVMMAAAVLRLSFTFAMARGEKRAWISMVLMIALGVLIASTNQISGTIRTLAVYPFYILNIKADETAMGLIAAFYALWIWFVPPVMYLIRLFCRKLVRTGLAWSDMLGGILWKERNARVYSALMLTCIAALYSGLAMDARVCRLMCIGAVLLFPAIGRAVEDRPANCLFCLGCLYGLQTVPANRASCAVHFDNPLCGLVPTLAGYRI